MKRPNEADKVDDPNYCKYHHLVSHPIEKCFVLKDKIMKLYKDGKIKFEEKVATSNLASISMDVQSNLLSRTIKFGSFDPIPFTLSIRKWVVLHENGGNIQDDNGWILVIR